MTRFLTKGSASMTGSSAPLVSADIARKIVIVCNAEDNDTAVVDMTGDDAAEGGVPLEAGGVLEVSGRAARSAMTQVGTNGQTLTVYTG